MPPAWSSSPGNSTRAREGEETASMATVSRPLVVLAGPIHPDGRALLEREARVVVSDDETEAGLVRAAVEAEGILFRIRRSEEHTSELQSLTNLVCRLLLEK